MIFFFTWYDNECNILRDTISDVNSLKRRLIQTIFDWYIFFGWNIYRQENKYLWRWLGQWLESTAVWPKTQRYLHGALTVRKWNSTCVCTNAGVCVGRKSLKCFTEVHVFTNYLKRNIFSWKTRTLPWRPLTAWIFILNVKFNYLFIVFDYVKYTIII